MFSNNFIQFYRCSIYHCKISTPILGQTKVEEFKAVETEESMSGRGKLVCVTGASGYIAAWLVKMLLERHYTVNATVRSLSLYFNSFSLHVSALFFVFLAVLI